MTKFKEAYFKEKNHYIIIAEYKDKLHYRRVYCPECNEAPIHIVEKQNTTYFASNRRDEHSISCQHYREHISQRKLNRLIESNLLEDKRELEFLIQSTLKPNKIELFSKFK